jgi:hypothetical protein
MQLPSYGGGTARAFHPTSLLSAAVAAKLADAVFNFSAGFIIRTHYSTLAGLAQYSCLLGGVYFIIILNNAIYAARRAKNCRRLRRTAACRTPARCRRKGHEYEQIYYYKDKMAVIHQDSFAAPGAIVIGEVFWPWAGNLVQLVCAATSTRSESADQASHR